MTPQDALAALLARVGANGGASVFVGAEELNEWPATAVAAMKAHRLLVKARPAVSVVCPGCERQCVMPVHTMPGSPKNRGSFVVCDKRSDINRVAVDPQSLEQWQADGESLADLLAQLLDLRRPGSRDADAERWEIGLLKGRKHASHLVLLGGGELKLSLAGHSIAVADVLELKDSQFAVDRATLDRLVDHPMAGAGDAESAERRRERLQARVRELKAAGTRAFLQQVAGEEGISVSRLKQIVAPTPVNVGGWEGLAVKKRASSKAAKPQHRRDSSGR